MPLLNNAKVKPNGNYGSRFMERSARRSHAIPPRPHKTQPSSPIFFPAERTTMLLTNQILCLLQSLGVKCLTCLTTTTPSPSRSIGVTCSHNAADKNVSTSRQRDASDYPHAAPGKLFTSRQNDVLQIWRSTTLCFWLFCGRLRP